jgi:Trk-type K+ transport system membrane component
MEEEIDYTGEKVIPNYCKSKLYYLFIEIILVIMVLYVIYCLILVYLHNISS